MRRCRLVLAGAALAGSVVLMATAPADAGTPGRRGILVVQVEGALDPPNAELVTDAIARANDDRLTMVVLQIDSSRHRRHVGGRARAHDPAVARPRRRVDRSARRRGGRRRDRAPRGVTRRIRRARCRRRPRATRAARRSRRREPRRGARRSPPARRANGRDPDAAARLADHSRSAAAAAASGAIDGVRPTLGETIVGVDGTTVRTAAGDVELSTAKVIGEGRGRRRQPNQDVVFDSLGIGGQLEHALLGPALAYFLFVAGLALIVFEFFAASIGFAAAVGGLCVIGAGYGFSGLPVRWWAVALLLLSALGFAIDAQAGGLGTWTAIGGASLVAGTVFLYGGSSDLRPPWWLLALVVLGVALFYMFGIPPFIRARFSTPTIGREGMIGEMGVAAVAVDPDGVVEIRDACWRAHTNRATPIEAGDRVRVVSVDGVVLEVEPETGGARDYRDRARSRKRAPDPT